MAPRHSFPVRLDPLGDRGARRVEQILARSRVVLALGFLLATYLAGPPAPSPDERITRGLLAAYVLYSGAILLLLRKMGFSGGWLYLIHALDVLWPVLVSLLAAGPNSSVFLFYVFVLFASAFRWGMFATLGTAVLLTGCLFGQFALFPYSSYTSSFGPDLDATRLFTRTAYLLLTGVFAGYLGEQHKQGKAEWRFVVGCISRARMENGVAKALQRVFAELFRWFRCERALLIARDDSSGRTFLWEVRDDRGTDPVLHYREITGSEKPDYSLPAPEGVYRVVLQSEGKLIASGFSKAGTRVAKQTLHWPPAIPAPKASRALMDIFVPSREMTMLLVLDGPARNRCGNQALRLLQEGIAQVSPVIHNLYLLQRIRRQAAALERNRIARELHDGAVQGFFGVELRLQALRNRLTDPQVCQEMEELQKLVNEQMFMLRDVIEEARITQSSPEEVVPLLASIVTRFGRETGIQARFTSALTALPPSFAYGREFSRLLQEALVNVRKHSNAHGVQVSLAAIRERLRLVIEDDGRGFPFAGTRTLAELAASHCGPAIIVQRVRALGGELAIRSTPGHGARLEITAPLGKGNYAAIA